MIRDSISIPDTLMSHSFLFPLDFDCFLPRLLFRATTELMPANYCLCEGRVTMSGGY